MKYLLMTFCAVFLLTVQLNAQKRISSTGYLEKTVSNETATWETYKTPQAVDGDFYAYADTIASFFIEGSNIDGQFLAIDTISTTVAAPLARVQIANLPTYWRIRYSTAGLDTPIKFGWKLKEEKQ